MKKNIIFLLVCLCTSALNALEYHFPDNKVQLLPNKQLKISFVGENRGFEKVIKILESFSELPADYPQFLQTAKELEGAESSDFYEVFANAFSEGGEAKWEDMSLNISERTFKKALQELEIEEEQKFYKIKLKSKSQGGYSSTIRVNPVPEPKVLIMKCKRIDKQNANCWFVDEKEKEIKKLICNWQVSYPADLEKRIKQTIEETKQKEMDEKKAWNITYAAQKKECRSLYRTLSLAKRGVYVDPVVGLKTAKRFKELYCDTFLETVQMYNLKI